MTSKQDNEVRKLIKRLAIETLLDANFEDILYARFERVNVDKINPYPLEITVTPKQTDRQISVLLEMILE